MSSQPVSMSVNGPTRLVSQSSSTPSNNIDIPPVQERQTWSRKVEFLLTLIGYAVGLGNIWRFPYLAYQNGGGAFLIPYLLMLFLIGIPLFFQEVAIGQFASLGPVAVYKFSPFTRGVGLAAILVTSYINTYYQVVVAWAMYFLFASMGSEVPWKHCNNKWNTPNCVEGRYNITIHGNITGRIKTPTEEYFYNKVLQMSGGIEHPDGVVWQLLLLLFLGWMVVYMVLIKGIKSLGKFSYFTSVFPYVLLTIMLIRGATLEGARSGVEFYVRPDFNRLRDSSVWTSAASQITFSLGLACGNLIALASYNKFDNNCKRDALTVPFCNCGTSFYGGFVIFSVLGYMANQKGVPVKDVVESGPALVFVVYPEALSQMPVSPLWSVLFFLMMCSLGFSSQFAQTEAVSCVFLDEFPSIGRKGVRPVVFRFCVCFFFFLMGIPLITRGGYYLFRIVNSYSADYGLLSVAVLQIVSVHYFYGHKKFLRDISLMIGQEPGIYWRATWLVISPILIIVLVIMKATQQANVIRFGDYTYPSWAASLAWMMVASPLVVVVLCALWDCMQKGGYQAMKNSIKSTDDWGPATKENRKGTVYEIRDRRNSAKSAGSISHRVSFNSEPSFTNIQDGNSGYTSLDTSQIDDSISKL